MVLLLWVLLVLGVVVDGRLGDVDGDVVAVLVSVEMLLVLTMVVHLAISPTGVHHASKLHRS